MRESERSLVAMYVRSMRWESAWRDGFDGVAERPLRDLKHSLIRLSRVHGGVHEEVSVWRTLSWTSSSKTLQPPTDTERNGRL